MKAIDRTSVVLLAVNGFLALLGGIPMVLDPSGSLNQMPVEWLNGSPFPDYLIPGIILSTVIGLFSLLTVIAYITRHKLTPYMTMAEGFMLIVWIVVQMLVIPVYSLLQPTFMLLGLALIMLGLIQRNHFVSG